MSAPEAYCKVRYQPTAEELGMPVGREMVFGGLFLAWLAHRELLAPDFPLGRSAIVAVKRRQLTGPELLDRIDGIIDSDLVSERARPFCAHYFALMNSSAYLNDFKRTFGITGNQSKDLYVVEDSWANFDKLAPVLDAAFERGRY